MLLADLCYTYGPTHNYYEHGPSIFLRIGPVKSAVGERLFGAFSAAEGSWRLRQRLLGRPTNVHVEEIALLHQKKWLSVNRTRDLTLDFEFGEPVHINAANDSLQREMI